MRQIIEAFSGIMIIILGILFFFYLPTNPTNVAGNAIFIGAGYLVIRRAYRKNKHAVPEIPSKKEKKGTSSQNQRADKRRTALK